MPKGGGAGGGHGPRAQALEGAPAQIVGPNCKKKIRPRQISKVTSLQSAVADAGFTKRGGGTPIHEGASRVGLCSRGGYNSGGGGGDASIGPRALETLGTPLTNTYRCVDPWYTNVHVVLSGDHNALYSALCPAHRPTPDARGDREVRGTVVLPTARRLPPAAGLQPPARHPLCHLRIPYQKATGEL